MEKKEEYFQVLKKMTKSFSGDEFYQLFQELLSRGKNSVQIYRSKKNKIIDKEWVNFIEGCIVSLDNIIRNPRKFIAREEEIVPIELSRSITTESVKHLAQHTNLISEVTEDSITPNKILNINKEESFDVYENRFVYTLLLRLKDFVDKRVDLIVNAMVDNDIVNVDVKSDFLFENRVVDYELKLNTKANSDDVDATNSEEVQILQRVTKMSKIINDFCSSPFANVMKKSALVKPPITRTNAILKNPDFKKALTLWQFIETYDKVGFDVQTEESIEDISKDSYQIMSDNIFMNMILYKNVLELNDPSSKVERKSHYTPKFMKKFMDLMVNSIDFDDVEFKKVFIETYNNRQQELDNDQVEKINKVIDDALLADERYLLELELERQRIEREKQEAIERKKREEEARKEAIRLAKEEEARKIREAKEAARLAKEEEKRKIAEAKAEERRKAQEEKERKRQEILARKKAAEEAKRLKAEEEARKAKEAQDAELQRLMEIKNLIQDKTYQKQLKLEEAARLKIESMKEDYLRAELARIIRENPLLKSALKRKLQEEAEATPVNEIDSFDINRRKAENAELYRTIEENVNIEEKYKEKQEVLEEEARKKIKDISNDYLKNEFAKAIEDSSSLAKSAILQKVKEDRDETLNKGNEENNESKPVEETKLEANLPEEEPKNEEVTPIEEKPQEEQKENSEVEENSNETENQE